MILIGSANLFAPSPTKICHLGGIAWDMVNPIGSLLSGFLGIFVIAQEPYLLGPSIHFYLSLNQVWQISMARYKRAPRVFFGKYHILVYQKVVLQPWCQNMIFLLWKLCLHVNLESFFFKIKQVMSIFRLSRWCEIRILQNFEILKSCWNFDISGWFACVP